MNPGHKITEGYPHIGPISREIFKNRPIVEQMNDGKIQVTIDEAIWGNIEDKGPRNDFEDFLLHRLFDYSEALKAAEDQITDMLHEDPFVPEDFGFVLMHKNKDITEAPVRIYTSKFDDTIILYRKPGSIDDKDWNPAMWVLEQKAIDPSGNDQNPCKLTTILNLPCARIAYAAFFAIGIKMKEEKVYDPNIDLDDDLPPAPSHIVQFYRKDGIVQDNCSFNDLTRKIGINAPTDKEALTQAKFLLETDPVNPISDIQFNELSIVQ